MRNSENYIITGTDTVSANDETTWPFPGALHSLLNGKLLYSSFITVMTVVAMVGLLFLWLMG